MTSIPKFESPRAALNVYRADLIQAITTYEFLLGTSVDPFAAELVGPAIAAITAHVQHELAHLRHRQVRHVVIAANQPWASEARFYHWTRKTLAADR